jgi:hypothetical protein
LSSIVTPPPGCSRHTFISAISGQHSAAMLCHRG